MGPGVVTGRDHTGLHGRIRVSRDERRWHRPAGSRRFPEPTDHLRRARVGMVTGRNPNRLFADIRRDLGSGPGRNQPPTTRCQRETPRLVTRRNPNRVSQTDPGRVVVGRRLADERGWIQPAATDQCRESPEVVARRNPHRLQHLPRPSLGERRGRIRPGPQQPQRRGRRGWCLGGAIRWNQPAEAIRRPR